MRENAAKYCIEKSKIAVIGFSAGGHLSELLATVKEDEISDVLGELAKYARPDAAILSYPVVTMADSITHEGSQRVISRNGAINSDKLSLERRVISDSTPAFICHTSEDGCVPVENSFLLASAYRKAGVPFSLHIFEKGWHGLATADIEVNNELYPFMSRVKEWIPLAVSFLRAHGFEVEVCPR